MVKNTHIISMLKINNLRVSYYRAFREYRCHNNHLTNQLINNLTRSELMKFMLFITEKIFEILNPEVYFHDAFNNPRSNFLVHPCLRPIWF